MSMKWGGILILVLVFIAGYWAQTKMPGLLTKATGGIITA